MNISKANLLNQIKRSDIDKLLSSLYKLSQIIKLPPKDVNLWRNIYDQVCSDRFAKMGAKDPTPHFEIYDLVEKYCQKDVKYAEALSQRQEKIGQIMGEIEHILRLKSVEPLLRYDREQSGNLRVIARKIEDHTNDKEWYFTDNDKQVINAIVFLQQTKNKLPLWYDEQTEQKPPEASGKVEKIPQKKRRKAPPQILKESRERQAAQELAKNPNITAEELGKILDCDKSTIVRLKAWKNKDVLKSKIPNGFIRQTKDDDGSIEAIDEPQ